MDIGNPADIHPKNKKDVGERLALWALAKTYDQKDLVYSGPLYNSLEIKENTAIVQFSNIGSGLVSRRGRPSHFEIAGDDRIFYPAKAKINGSTVVVSSRKVKEPVAVRYACHNSDEPNLYNREGLPAASFRTDSWEIIR